jgi:hypothetical protein
MSLIKHGQFWYVGTPYSKYPHPADGSREEKLEYAFWMASDATAKLADERIPVYSPIAHSHPISKFVGGVSPTDHDFWVEFDAPMVNAAAGLIVVMADSWEVSRGLQHEILQFQRAGKPVVYWDPKTTPDVAALKPAVTGR